MTTTGDIAAPTSVFDPRYRAVTISILMTVALGAFEGLAVAAALPDVAADLGGVRLLPWVISAFLMAAGSASPVAGALVDRLGVRPTFAGAVTVFVVGSLLCGVAPSMGVLVAARVLQGIGAGATNATALAAVGLVFPRHLVARAFAVNSVVWGVMSVAGPALAAGLLLVASWRWIFWVNLPLGALALVLGWRALPSRPLEGAANVRISPLTVSLLVVFSVGSLVALERLSWWSLPALVVALAAGWAVLRRSRGREDALIAPRHVITAPLGPLAWTVGLLLVGGIGLQAYMPFYVAAGRGVSVSLAAWSVIFFVVGWTVGAQASSRLMDERTSLTVLTLGVAAVAPAAAVAAVLIGFDAPLWTVFVAAVVAGTGMGMATNAALTAIREFADDAEVGRAVAAHQYVRSQGFAGGPALAGGILLLVVATRTGDVEAIRELLTGSGGESAVAGTGASVDAAVRAGFAIAVGACSAVAALAHLPLRYVRRAAGGAAER